MTDAQRAILLRGDGKLSDEELRIIVLLFAAERAACAEREEAERQKKQLYAHLRAAVAAELPKMIEGNALNQVKTATLIYVSILSRVRYREEEKTYTPGYLPFSVSSLLYSLRVPGCA